MADLTKPKEVEIKDCEGNYKTFIISRIPAVPMREVMAKYPVSNIPKLGEYQASKEVMGLLMSYVAVRVGEEGKEREIQLTNTALINNHVPDAESLLRIEYAMLQYNTSFFGQGDLSTFLRELIAKHLPLITQTVMDSLRASSPVARDLSVSPNSKQP
jgi:hypothetical protein